ENARCPMIRISPIPALESNYFWLIQPDQHQSTAYVVDPGDASPVRERLAQDGLDLAAILVTHHHRDHISGIAALQAEFDVPVYGRPSERIPCITDSVQPGESLTLGTMTFDVLDVAGHT